MKQNNANHFLGINWTVRSKHPQFWLGLILSILVPPLSYTGTEFNEVTSWGKFFDILGDGFANPYIVLMMIVGIYNTIVDKTTKGFGDSYIAKQYLRPRTDYDPKQALDWEINVEKKAKAREEQDEKLKLEEYERQKENEEMIEKEPKPKNEMTDEEYDQYYTTQTKDDGLDDGKPLREPVNYDETQPFTDDSEDVEFTIVDIADNTPQPKEQPAVDEWEDENEVKGSNPDDPKDIPEKPPEQDKEVDESKEVK